MATLTDRFVGILMILAAAGIFTYYTAWVIVLPFLEPGHFLLDYFPPRWYAVGLPVAAGVVLVTVVGIFVGVVLIKENSRKKQKQA